MTSVENDPIGVFFWARSGGGHRTAKEGVKQQKIKEYAAQGKTLDTKADYDITDKVLNLVQLPFAGGLGDLGVKSWDEAQKKGDLRFLERWASLQWIGEIIFYPLVYFRVKCLLQDLRVEPEFVVSTQAFCLNAIMRAMQSVNKEKKWNMHMHVYLTDMPSKKATHFFPSIKKVADDESLRPLITVHAAPPLLKPGQTEKDAARFWEKYCGKVKVITNEKFPIREAFLETGVLKKRLEQPTVNVRLKLNHPSEASVIQSGLNATAKASCHFDEATASISVKNEDKVGFLMLGSQPTTQSVLNWLHTFVASSKKSAPKEGEKHVQHYLFLYCGASHTSSVRNPLLDAVEEEIRKLSLPPHFNIIPFTNQEAEEIALLMARNDISITRSGGGTAMELLQLHEADIPKRPNKRTLIHTEAKQDLAALNRIRDHKEFREKIVAEIAQQTNNKSLMGSAEWKAIRNDMRKFVQGLGYSANKSRLIVDNILSLYSGKDTPDLEEIFNGLQQNAKLLSERAAKREKKIREEMRRMKEKSKYQDMTLADLKTLAVERVLTREGIAVWEASNAKYLKKKLGATVVNPEYAAGIIDSSFFKTNE